MMNRRTFILSSCASCASLLALHRAEAQAVNFSDEAIRDILRRRIDVEKRATGMAVGIVERGRRRVIVYGKQDSGGARSVAAGTLFEIGSLTKVFTALLLADMRLKDTALHPTGEATRRLAAGHDPKLAPIPPLDLGIFAPAGALRSTVENLLSFVTAVLPNSRSPLEAPAQLLLSIRRPAPAIGGDQALGWDVVTGTDPFVAKDGVTAGQAASIVLDAPKQIGVVVLSNALPVKMKAPPDGGVGAADLARHLIRPALPVG